MILDMIFTGRKHSGLRKLCTFLIIFPNLWNFEKKKKLLNTYGLSTLKTAGFLNVISNPMSVLELAKHPKSTQKNTAEKFSSLFPQILTYKATCLASRNLCQENSCRQKSSQSPHQAALLLDV